jgi:hypothetical protein
MIFTQLCSSVATGKYSSVVASKFQILSQRKKNQNQYAQ